MNTIYLIIFITTLLCGCHTPSVQVGRVGGDHMAEAVHKQYDQAWHLPDETSQTPIEVKALVVIAKNGQVLSAHIVKPSGDLAIDQSVQRALDRVRRVPPFDAGVTNAQKNFYINFNLKPKI